MKNDILLIIKLPPPITGATLMNQRLNNSKYIRRKYNIRTIAASYSKSVSDMGRINFYKILCFSKVFNKLLINLIVFNPDLVYFQISPLNGPFIRDSLLVLLLKIFRKRIVFHIRGKGIQNNIAHNSILRYYYEFIFRNTDVICLSELLTYDIEPFKINKIHILNNGIPDNYSGKIVDFSSGEYFKILYISNLIKTKGILDFINAISILVKKNLKVRGLIVGEEADISKEFLISYLKKKNVSSKIEYLGAKYDKEKFKILESSHALVFPTYYPVEAFPGVVVEGMQFALPVISTNEASIPVMIDDGITGFIVDTKSPKQIAEKIEYLINNPEKRTEMGKAGRKKFLEKYTINKFEENMKNVFNEILSKEK